MWFEVNAGASAGPATRARLRSCACRAMMKHNLTTSQRVQQDSASRKAGRKRKALLELLDQVENIVQTRSPEQASPPQASGGGGSSPTAAQRDGDRDDDQNADRYTLSAADQDLHPIFERSAALWTVRDWQRGTRAWTMWYN